MPRRRRGGFALIESLVALAVLGIAGLALVELSAETVRSLERARAAEERIADMDRLMSAYTLLERRDLDRRVGSRRVGEYQVRVERLGFDLFRVGIGGPNAAPDLRTTLYRPGAEGE